MMAEQWDEVAYVQIANGNGKEKQQKHQVREEYLGIWRYIVMAFWKVVERLNRCSSGGQSVGVYWLRLMNSEN